MLAAHKEALTSPRSLRFHAKLTSSHIRSVYLREASNKIPHWTPDKAWLKHQAYAFKLSLVTRLLNLWSTGKLVYNLACLVYVLWPTVAWVTCVWLASHVQQKLSVCSGRPWRPGTLQELPGKFRWPPRRPSNESILDFWTPSWPGLARPGPGLQKSLCLQPRVLLPAGAMNDQSGAAAASKVRHVARPGRALVSFPLAPSALLSCHGTRCELP